MQLKGLRKSWPALAVLLLIGALGIAWPLNAQGTTPVFEETQCWFDPPAGETVDCGYVTVPESRYSAPSDNTVQLAVAVFRAGSTSSADPVIYLDGGPGVETLSGMPDAWETFGVFAETDRDVIFFDQRGIGESTPTLDCQAIVDLSLELLPLDVADAEVDALFNEALLGCRQEYIDAGIDLSAYNTAESAADVRDIITALGYEQVNLVGISYGSFLAQIVMRDHPQIVRSVILDAVVPPDRLQFSVSGQILDVQRGFRTLFEGCAADALCASAYPNLEQVLWDTAAELNETPILRDVEGPITGDIYEMLITGDSLISAVIQGLYIDFIIPFLPRMIYEASIGEFQIMDILVGLQVDTLEDAAYVMQYSVLCYEDGPYITPELISEVVAQIEYPALLDYIKAEGVPFESIITFCETWRGGLESPSIIEAVESDLPTLLMSGEYDPVTPLAYAEQVSETLTNFYSYLFPGYGHGASVDGGCATSIAVQFINDPTTEPDASCIDNLQPPLFDVPPGTQPVDNRPVVTLAPADVVLVDYESAQLGIAGVAPDGWDIAEEGVYVFPSSAQFLQVAYRVPEDGIDGYFQRILIENYGYTEVPEPFTTYRVNGITWEIRAAEAEIQFQEVYSLFATAEIDGQGYVIALVTGTAEDRDAFIQALLIPMIDSFRVTSSV
jgi:pimeloyl-ACP methyl ester carboxylesterase